MEALFYCLLLVAILAASVFVVVSNGQRGLLSLALKAIASFAFTTLALSVILIKGASTVGILFVLGFVASVIGDVVLALPDMPQMKEKAMSLTLVGGLSFAVAHVFYLSGMIVKFGFAWWVILIAIALGLIFFFGNKIVGKLNYGNLTAGMPVYSTFVSLVVAESIMSFVSGANVMGSAMLLVGFILFWLSDIVLMNIYFGNKTDKQKVNYYYFNLAFYYGAQILVAASLFFLL